MESFVTIFFACVIIFFVLWTIGAYIIYHNTPYCFFFERELYNTYKMLNKLPIEEFALDKDDDKTNFDYFKSCCEIGEEKSHNADKNIKMLYVLFKDSIIRSHTHKYFTIKSHPEWRVVCLTDERNCFVTNNETHECIASHFYKRGSKKLYNKLMKLYIDDYVNNN